MAKRRKAPRRSNGQTKGWHKKVFLGGLASVVLIGTYCYFTAQSEDIPVIGSMNYPKRTPGSIQNHSNYSVYDRLAESGSSKAHRQAPVSRLLPPNEVPEFPEEMISSNTPPALSPVLTQKGTLVSQKTTSSPEQSDLGKKPENSTLALKTIKKAPDGVTPRVKKQIDTKAVLCEKKKSVGVQKTGEKQAPGGVRKKVLGIQIGEVYTQEYPAKALLDRLVKRGGVRHGIRPILQKAKVKGVFRYRVILSGKCSKEDWSAYRSWLMRQEI